MSKDSATQQLMIPPLRTFETPGIPEPLPAKGTAGYRYERDEITQIVEEVKANGFGQGAIVCPIVNGVPQTSVYQRGIVTWVNTVQHHAMDYAPLEVRWVGGNGRNETLWPDKLMLLIPALSADDIATRVSEWHRSNQP